MRPKIAQPNLLVGFVRAEMAIDWVRMKDDEHNILKRSWDKLEFNILVIALEEFMEEQNPSLGDDKAVTDRLTVDVMHLRELCRGGKARV